ncbi:MAG: HEAT repeat domain-containing protein [Pyrinomonadaceae bacterium]
MAHSYSMMSRLTTLFTAIVVLGSSAAGQPSAEQLAEDAANQWWYTMILIVVCGLGLAIYFWKKSTRGALRPENDNRYASYYSDIVDDCYENVDADKELEWLRTVKNPKAKIPKIKFELKKAKKERREQAQAIGEKAAGEIDTKAFQEKMRKLQYAQLPINSFTQLANAKSYKPLPVSDDPSLSDAIDQASDEFEEDEAVREVALRVLAAFKTQNSVEAVAQIALYDLSANLRSKAVTTLAEFDHESVFETILLACADPTREVRAAAARGLFKLSFDRAHAWKRIIEANDEYRTTQAARAAIESGLVEKSIERLMHDDVKVAYEAFALCSMLIKAGETKEIIASLKNHTDLRVKFAILHLLQTQKDQRILPELYKIASLRSLSSEVMERLRHTISVYEEVNALAQ